MRLINIETLALEEFFGDSILRYAILSHTWEAEEISFQDYNWIINYDQELKDGIIDEFPPKQRARLQEKGESLKKRTGYSKIQRFVSLALGYHEGVVDLESPYAREIRHSIPPVNYVWVDTCCINKESSAELLEQITGIRRHFLTARFRVEVPSIASKMSWAARRETMRVEDEAYCLIGLWRQHAPSLRRGRTGIPAAAARDLANVGRPVHLPPGLWLAAQEPRVSAHLCPLAEGV